MFVNNTRTYINTPSNEMPLKFETRKSEPTRQIKSLGDFELAACSSDTILISINSKRKVNLLVNGNFLETLKRMFWRAGMVAQDIVWGGSSHQNSLSADSAESAHSSSCNNVRLFSLVSRVFFPAWWCCFPVTSHAHARLFRLWSPTTKRAQQLHNMTVEL